MRDYQSMARYQEARGKYPNARAIDLFNFVRDDHGVTFEQFTCRHEWTINEESDRCYCLCCGADGDA